MKEIVFVNPPLTLKERYGKLSGAGNTLPSLGLCWLAAVCREDGFQAGIIDSASLALDHEETLGQLFAEPPQYVGITATTPAIFSASQLARRIKEKDKNIVILLGGPHITAIPEETMRQFREFDIGVLGEGEETILDLLRRLRGKQYLGEAKGLIFREGESLRRTENRPFIKDLNRLPMPAWDLLPDFPKGYVPPSFRFQRLPASYLVTSRGCPRECAFCDRSVFGHDCRFFSAEYIFEMVDRLKKRFGVKELLFEDDNFTLHQQRLITLCEKLIKAKMDLTWSCLGRVDTVDLSLLRLMKKAGCWQIGYGLESGDKGVLDFARKKIELEQARETLELTRKAGIRTKGFFILGLPLESHETMRRSINFAKKNALDDITVTFFTPFPGSVLHGSAKDFGEFNNEWKRMNMLETVFVPKGLAKEDLEKGLRSFLREFYLRPKIVFAYFLRVISHPFYSGKIFRGLFALLKNTF